MRLTVVRGPAAAGPFELQEGAHVAGRSADCAICLPSKKVSRHHCRFEVRGDRLMVVDLGSHNGLIDGAGNKVTTIELPPGGRVQVGDFLLTRVEEGELIEVDLDDADEELAIEEEAPEPNPFGPSLTAVPLGSPAKKPELKGDPMPVFRDEARPAPADKAAAPPLFKADARKPEAPSLFKPGARLGEPRKPEPAPKADPPRPDPAASSPPAGEGIRLPPSPPHPAAEPPKPAVEPVRPAARPADPAPSTAPPPLLRPRGRGGRPDVPLLHASGPPWLLGAAFAGLVALALVVCGGQIGVRAVLPPSSEATIAESDGADAALLVAARNTDALAADRVDALDVGLVSDRPGVREARVTDARGMVLAPPEKYRINLANRESFRQAGRTGKATVVAIGGGVYEVLAPVQLRAGGPILGWAWVEYDAAAVAATRPSATLALGALVASAVVAGLVLFAGAALLVLRPLTRMAEEAEQVVEGNADTLRPRIATESTERLARAFNVLAARVRDLEGANNP